MSSSNDFAWGVTTAQLRYRCHVKAFCAFFNDYAEITFHVPVSSKEGSMSSSGIEFGHGQTSFHCFTEVVKKLFEGFTLHRATRNLGHLGLVPALFSFAYDHLQFLNACPVNALISPYAMKPLKLKRPVGPGLEVWPQQTGFRQK
jgi:hypothetical protein